MTYTDQHALRRNILKLVCQEVLVANYWVVKVNLVASYLSCLTFDETIDFALRCG